MAGAVMDRGRGRVDRGGYSGYYGAPVVAAENIYHAYPTDLGLRGTLNGIHTF